MHTRNMMGSNDFDIEVKGQSALLEEIFEGFNEYDRIGVVVRETAGGIGASALLMSAVARFYDFFRPQLGFKPDQLVIYPQFYIFHVGKKQSSYYYLDIWPPHKEVVVEDEPEQILGAINDRGITRLLVEDIPPVKANFLRETVSAAKHQIITALAYSPTGNVKDSDVKITSCEAAEKCVFDSLQNSKELSKDVVDGILEYRKKLMINGRVTETYRKIDLETALNLLSPKSSVTGERYYALLEE
ncbi:hypothetical protein E2K98_04965 [Bacillus salipaludis]|uniref:Uncharacterized protein n=1 Tax=Bacillus salipaludis TaxID=2547811 RepID=A0A4R5W0B5_9BACI|nr:hypothetical protein E2K98_04965 [Bacillus salipaludis]